GTSCKCVENIKDVCSLHNLVNAVTVIAVPERLSVPLQSSSPNTKVCSSILRIMVRNSNISTIKDECPFKISSLPESLVMIFLYGLNFNFPGTYIPACAIIIQSPTLLVSTDFPAELQAYNKIPIDPGIPKETSLDIYSVSMIRSTNGCLKSLT